MNPEAPRIRKAEFLKSAVDASGLPPADRPEYAFVGRSNVGKSSLINYLCGRNGLAKTSSTPGKTQTLNYFSIDDEWYLVDLPGYGYAKTSKDQRKNFQEMITGYLTGRFSLVHTFLLIDIRHEPLKIDLDFIAFLGESELSFSIVFTKADKLGPNAALSRQEAYHTKLLETWEEPPPMFITSAESKRGGDPILSAIRDYNRVAKPEIRHVFDFQRQKDAEDKKRTEKWKKMGD